MNNNLAYDIMISFCLINTESFELCDPSMGRGILSVDVSYKENIRRVEGKGGAPIINCVMRMVVSSGSILIEFDLSDCNHLNCSHLNFRFRACFEQGVP